eukprot:IDg18156t1
MGGRASRLCSAARYMGRARDACGCSRLDQMRTRARTARKAARHRAMLSAATVESKRAQCAISDGRTHPLRVPYKP